MGKSKKRVFHYDSKTATLTHSAAPNSLRALYKAQFRACPEPSARDFGDFSQAAQAEAKPQHWCWGAEGLTHRSNRDMIINRVKRTLGFKR